MNHSVFQLGVTFGFRAPKGYFSTDATRREIDAIAQTGATWVAVVPTVIQEHYYSVRQYQDFRSTPDDRELEELIGLIRSRGMQVHLRPMLECLDGAGRTRVTLENTEGRIPGLGCNYRAQWFESMTERAVHYARIAERTGCAVYGLDSELDRTVSANEEWKAVTRAVRREYAGPVTSCHTHAVDFCRDLQNPAHWFFDLDLLSTSFYFPAADRAGTSAADMQKRLQEPLTYYRQMAQLYGKPILFGECGCTSAASGAANPSATFPDAVPDNAEQAHYLEAVLNTFRREPWWCGLYW